MALYMSCVEKREKVDSKIKNRMGQGFNPGLSAYESKVVDMR